ncbi:DUF3021 domain-containing protein [Macrococcus capreoli]
MKKLVNAFTQGVCIGLIISVICSFFFAGGKYVPLYPTSFMGEIYYEHFNEPFIMLICACIWGCIGIMFTYGNLIFTDTDWSIPKQTFVHFGLMLVLFIPLAILAGWFPLHLESVMSFILIFVIIYIIIWIANYQWNKKIVRDINNRLKHKL